MITIFVIYFYTNGSWLLELMSCYTLFGLLTAREKNIVKEDNYIALTYNDIGWALMRHKSPAYRLFVQKLVRFIQNKTSKLCITGPLWGKPLVTSGFPSKAQWYETRFQVMTSPGFSLGIGPANERRCYIVATSLIDWAHTYTDPSVTMWSHPFSQ